jgi:hypothetical protein
MIGVPPQTRADIFSQYERKREECRQWLLSHLSAVNYCDLMVAYYYYNIMCSTLYMKKESNSNECYNSPPRNYVHPHPSFTIKFEVMKDIFSHLSHAQYNHCQWQRCEH